MGDDLIALVADLGSPENSRDILAKAITAVTGRGPVMLDARLFMRGGPGTARLDDTGVCFEVDGVVVRPDAVFVYEVDPADRYRLEEFLGLLGHGRVRVWGAEFDGWRNATDKARTVECFARAGIPHAETITLRNPSPGAALAAYRRLGGDVWARPATGLGGRGVFHLRTESAVVAAAAHYSARRQAWQMCRDAGNVDTHGDRHQFRVVVHGEQVLRVCEHIQRDHDRPCNESQGAISTVWPPDALDRRFLDMAIAATRAVGLSFGGVDLIVENGGMIIEVNVHPVLDVPGGLEGVATPLVRSVLADLESLDEPLHPIGPTDPPTVWSVFDGDRKLGLDGLVRARDAFPGGVDHGGE